MKAGPPSKQAAIAPAARSGCDTHEQLEQHLARGLEPLYAIHGDEPLLALEAADASAPPRARQGYTEREVLIVERGFDWGELALAASSRMSLFGDRSKLLELRIPNGKPGTTAARRCRTTLSDLPADTVTLIDAAAARLAARRSRLVRSARRVPACGRGARR